MKTFSDNPGPPQLPASLRDYTDRRRQCHVTISSLPYCRRKWEERKKKKRKKERKKERSLLRRGQFYSTNPKLYKSSRNLAPASAHPYQTVLKILLT
jgi:hypothetical protein